MLGSRWLAVLTVAAVIALGATSARAQVFRPRTGKGAAVGRAPAAQKAAPVAAAAASSKKPARPAATAPRRDVKKRGKGRDSAEAVVIHDGDDDDVTISDD